LACPAGKTVEVTHCYEPLIGGSVTGMLEPPLRRDPGFAEHKARCCVDGVKKISPTLFEAVKRNFEATRDLDVLIANWPGDEGQSPLAYRVVIPKQLWHSLCPNTAERREDLMTNSISQSWDPLEAADGTDQELLSAAKKREIKNILKSYVSNYDPFSELLQNAMDAVERRRTSGEEFIPKIRVRIDLTENSLEVVDNGCGFSETEFKSFLAPSISFKSGSKTRGNKGVGVTYVAYGFNSLTIRTKNSGFSFDGILLRGRDWVEDVDGVVHRPRMEGTETSSGLFDLVDQGTSFKLTFAGHKIRPSNLAWYQAQTADQWLYLLLVKTPLGHINLGDLTASAVQFDLTVVSSDGTETCLSDQPARYKYPNTEISASQRLSVIRDVQQRALDAGKDINAAIQKFKQSNGLYETYDSAALKSLIVPSEHEAALIESFSIAAYGYFAYSTEVWDQLNDKKAKLRRGLRVLKGGLQLANNGMPQGELITIPLTKAIGHQNQTHVIVHFDGADPDLGRKGFQPELKELAERISVAIVRQLSGRRDILKADSGAQSNINQEIKVHEWLTTQEQYQVSNPLQLISENFFLPTKRISILSTPQSEQDVIVLFNQLIAGGVIRGIRLLSTTQVMQYDGIFRYVAEEPLSDLVFDAAKNPLGVLEEQLINAYVGPPKILEYKFSLDGLIREFESEVKSQSDISLVIFWDFGKEYVKEYNVTSYLDFENIHQRPHHGVTHQLTSAHTKFDAICLKELIELLNDSEAAQEHQREAYGDALF
jgi:Domain of unknown function (DUF4424)